MDANVKQEPVTQRFAFPKGDEGLIWASMEMPKVPADATAAQQSPLKETPAPAAETADAAKEPPVFEFERGDGFKFRVRG